MTLKNIKEFHTKHIEGFQAFFVILLHANGHEMDVIFDMKAHWNEL